MEYTIRVMTEDDIESAIALWKGMEGVGLDEICDSFNGISKYLKRNPGGSFAAYSGIKLVGAVLCGHDGRRGYLHHLAVSAEHRNKGIGKRLVRHCLDNLSVNGIPKCNIFLFGTNETGRKFWTQIGWKTRNDLALLQQFTQ